MGGVQALYRQVFIRGRQEVRFKQDMMIEVEIGVIGPWGRGYKQLEETGKMKKCILPWACMENTAVLTLFPVKLITEYWQPGLLDNIFVLL